MLWEVFILTNRCVFDGSCLLVFFFSNNAALQEELFLRSFVMLRRTTALALRATPIALNNGPTFLTGGVHTGEQELTHYSTAYCHPVNERGVHSSSMFQEPNTSVYDSIAPWTYFQPHAVKIDVLPAPEPKDYQRLTRKPWDISMTEWMEVQQRKSIVAMLFWAFMTYLAYFGLHKEKSYDGTRGSDGTWVLLPKNRPEWF